MGFVMAAFVAILIIVVVVWLLSLTKSRSADNAESVRKQAEEAERRRKDAEEAYMNRKGSRLHCMGCGLDFLGPLADDGCPHCHVRSLVISQAEFQRTQRNQSGT